MLNRMPKFQFQPWPKAKKNQIFFSMAVGMDSTFGHRSSRSKIFDYDHRLGPKYCQTLALKVFLIHTGHFQLIRRWRKNQNRRDLKDTPEQMSLPINDLP